MPNIVERVISISNDGTKMIDGDALYVSFEDINFDILHEAVFAESALSKHVVTTETNGSGFKIILNKFNPHDKLYIIIDTDKPVGVGVDSKGAGYTLSSIFHPDCGLLGSLGFSGVQIFNFTSPECSDDLTRTSCHKKLKFRIPENFPKGPSRVIFK